MTGGAQTGVDHQCHILFLVILGIDPQATAVHFQAWRLAIQGDQAAEVLGALQGLGKIHFHMGFRVVHCPHIGDCKRSHRRDVVVALALVFHAKRAAIPAQGHLAGLVTPTDTGYGESMAQAGLVVLPAYRQVLLVLAGTQAFFHLVLICQIPGFQAAGEHHLLAIIRRQQGLHSQAQLLAHDLQGEFRRG